MSPLILSLAGKGRTSFSVSPGPPSGDAPAFTAAGNQTLLYAGDSDDTHYDSLAACGAGPAQTGTTRFIPEPSAAFQFGQDVDATRCAIVTGKDDIGKALRMTYLVQGAQQGPKFWVLNVGTPSAGATFYATYKVKFNGSAPGTIASKWFHVVLDGMAQGAVPQYSLSWSSPYTSSSGKHTVWQVYNDAYSDVVGAYPDGHDQATQPFGPYVQDLFDGEWHSFAYAYRSHTSSGDKDGIQQMWVDGTKIIDMQQSTVGVTPDGGEKQWTSQPMVDNAIIATGLNTTLPFSMGGTSFLGVDTEWGFDLNIGNGNGTAADTAVFWYEDAA